MHNSKIEKNDNIFVELGPGNTLIEDFETPPNKRHMGFEEVPDSEIEDKNIKIKIGNKPTALNLTNYISKNKGHIELETLEQYKLLFNYYDLWLINHSIGITREWGRQDITQLGYEMEFLNTDSTDIIVLSVLPNSEYVKKAGGNLIFEAGIKINGELSKPLVNSLEKINISLQDKITISSNLVLNLSFSINTPRITSVGEQSTYSKWFFRKGDKPLYGDDIKMYQIILTEKRLNELSFKARVSAIIPTWNLLPSGRIGEWLELSCSIIS